MRAFAKVREVPRPPSLTAESFEADYVRAGEPVILRGLAARWPARSWNFPEVAERLPARPLRVCGVASTEEVTPVTRELAPAELERRLSAERHEAEFRDDWLFDVLRDLPELLPELPAPPVHRGAFQYRLFMGRDTRSHGHYHAYQHAMICQIHGSKRVRLFPPGDSPFLYPYPLERETRHYQTSKVDFAAPDLEKFPKLSRAHPLEAHLEAGDALFIPVHFWHAAYGSGRVMSTSLFWNARFRDHCFPHPGLRTLVSMLRWDAWPKLRGVA